MEVFDSNGRLIFTTRRKTLRVHAFGNVVTSGTTTVFFDPLDEKPELFIGNPGIFQTTNTPGGTFIISPLAGPFGKTNQGKYDRFEMVIGVTAHLPPNVIVPGETPFPWTIPYVVFY